MWYFFVRSVLACNYINRFTYIACCPIIVLHPVVRWNYNGLKPRVRFLHLPKTTLLLHPQSLQSKMSMRLKRYGDWIEYVTESGRTFYYNDRDGSFQWERPLEAGGGGSGGGKGKQQNATSITSSGESAGIAYSIEGITAGAHEVQQQRQQHEQDYQQQHAVNQHYPWRAYLDPECGSVFWYNEVTHVSQWDMPAEFANAGDGGAAGAAAVAAAAAAAEGDGNIQGNSAKKNRVRAGVRDILDCDAGSNAHYNIESDGIAGRYTNRSGINNSTPSKKLLRSNSFDDDHDIHDTLAVAVFDHENDLGI